MLSLHLCCFTLYSDVKGHFFQNINFVMAQKVHPLLPVFCDVVLYQEIIP